MHLLLEYQFCSPKLLLTCRVGMLRCRGANMKRSGQVGSTGHVSFSAWPLQAMTMVSFLVVGSANLSRLRQDVSMQWLAFDRRVQRGDQSYWYFVQLLRRTTHVLLMRRHILKNHNAFRKVFCAFLMTVRVELLHREGQRGSKNLECELAAGLGTSVEIRLWKVFMCYLRVSICSKIYPHWQQQY